MHSAPVILMAALAAAAEAQTATGWRLVWSDEFNGPAQSAPSSANWNYDVGASGWGNGEQETYTNSIQNVFEDGAGHLVIRAIRDASGHYTSGRIRTGQVSPLRQADRSWRYGRVEARIRLPFGPGVWPAFWMLGSNISSVCWPQCGEIDILENFGAKIDTNAVVHGTLHGPPASSSFAGPGVSADYSLPRGQTIASAFHVFAAEWAPGAITVSVDGAAYRDLYPRLASLRRPVGLRSSLLHSAQPRHRRPHDVSRHSRARHALSRGHAHRLRPRLPGPTPRRRSARHLPAGIVNAASGPGRGLTRLPTGPSPVGAPPTVPGNTGGFLMPAPSR